MNTSSGFFLYLALLAVVFYLLLIRPQQQRTKKHRELIQSLEKGDNVMTIGGIIGRIKSISDDIIKVEIADKIVIKLSKSAVSKKVE